MWIFLLCTRFGLPQKRREVTVAKELFAHCTGHLVGDIFENAPFVRIGVENFLCRVNVVAREPAKARGSAVSGLS